MVIVHEKPKMINTNQSYQIETQTKVNNEKTECWQCEILVIKYETYTKQRKSTQRKQTEQKINPRDSPFHLFALKRIENASQKTSTRSRKVPVHKKAITKQIPTSW